MLINWFTVIAQIINFLILVWLLSRFLYKPVLKAIDEREKLIASRIESAGKKEADALQEREEFRRKNEEFDRSRKSLMDTVNSEAAAERQRLMETARTDAVELQKKMQQELAEGKERFGESISRKMQEEVIELTRKALHDLASCDLEEQTVKSFIMQLDLAAANSEIVSAIRHEEQTLRIRSAFELSAAQKEEINAALRKRLGLESPAAFSTDAQLIAGIELLAGGYILGWNMSGYLSSVKKEIENMMARNAGAAAQPN